MNSSLALLAWLILLLALFFFDPARDRRSSWAMWIPLLWMFVAGSRLPSQWLAGGVVIEGNAFEEGSPVDRLVYTGLIALAIVVLVSRSFKFGAFIRNNSALSLVLFFALLSVVWSEAPFIAFKRWFRDLGDYVVILIPLTERDPFNAIRTLLRRLSFILVPLSVLLIKYFEMGRHYDFWSGVPEYVGAATSKNTLGGLCLVCGLGLFWDTASRWSDRKNRRTKVIIALNFTMIAMVLWLLNASNSATSRVCLTIGCAMVAACHTKAFKRSGFLQALFPLGYFLYLFLAFGLGLNAQLAGALGRDPTFTGRTVIWDAVLSTHTNPLLGTGYESFWLGPRLMQVWAITGYGINEAHNGFLDVYLNLGLIGVFIMISFLLASYVRICRGIQKGVELSSLGAAIWTVLLFASTTEAVLKNGLMWMVLLLGVTALPRTLAPAAAVSRKASNRVSEWHSAWQSSGSL
jgi:exopolysaccharide production protein ExoQ